MDSIVRVLIFRFYLSFVALITMAQLQPLNLLAESDNHASGIIIFKTSRRYTLT